MKHVDDQPLLLTSFYTQTVSLHVHPQPGKMMHDHEEQSSFIYLLYTLYVHTVARIV